MTENESRMLLYRSPLETAIKLHTHFGTVGARDFVRRWIRLLTYFRSPPLFVLDFWVSVAMRLRVVSGTVAVSDFEKAQFNLMASKAAQ